MIEDYLAVLGLTKYKNQLDELTDIIVLTAYIELLNQLDEKIDKVRNNEENIRRLRNTEKNIIEAFKHLNSKEAREKYFQKREEKGEEKRDFIKQQQRRINETNNTDEDLKKIIMSMENQTRAAKKVKETEYIPIVKKEVRELEYIPIAKGEYKKVITKEKMQDKKEQPKKTKNDRERA